MNNQLNKTHRPIPANSKRLSSREGSVQCVAANDGLGFGSLVLQKALFKIAKSVHTHKGFCTNIIHVSEQGALTRPPALGTEQNQAVLC